MNRINWSRVLLGGLVVGVVLGIFAAVMIPLFAAAWNESLETLGSSIPEATPAFIAGGAAINIALGIAAVWLYAAIRPRYAAGPKTAAIAGFVIWLILALANLSVAVLTDLTVADVAKTHGPSIVSLVVATIAGAWVYREPAP